MCRRPTRHVPAAFTVAVLSGAVLCLLGAADGLAARDGSALRTMGGDLVTFSADSASTVEASLVGRAVARRVERVDGVTAVEPLAVTLVGATAEGSDRSVPSAVIGFEGGAEGRGPVPGPGEAVVDTEFRDEHLVAEGDTIQVGPAGVPLTVTGFVAGAAYRSSAPVWVDLATWAEVTSTFDPDATPGRGAAQALVVSIDDGEHPAVVAREIDEATGGATETVTVAEAVTALPGVRARDAILRVALAVVSALAALVLALAIALVAVDDTPTTGLLRALGVSRRRLVTALVDRILLVSLVGWALGAAVTWAVAAGTGAAGVGAVGAGRPIRLSPDHFAVSAAVVIAVSLVAALPTVSRVATAGSPAGVAR
jgi:hypothetical protein